jgi:hypothetical protein
VPDGWALAEVTYDRILWPEEVPGITLGGKVLRRVPSVLDVAYSVLGNGATHRLIAAGTFQERKQQLETIEALGRLKADGLSDFELLFYGYTHFFSRLC